MGCWVWLPLFPLPVQTAPSATSARDSSSPAPLQTQSLVAPLGPSGLPRSATTSHHGEPNKKKSSRGRILIAAVVEFGGRLWKKNPWGRARALCVVYIKMPWGKVGGGGAAAAAAAQGDGVSRCCPFFYYLELQKNRPDNPPGAVPVSLAADQKKKKRSRPSMIRIVVQKKKKNVTRS